MSVRLIAAALALAAIARATPANAQQSSMHGPWLGGGLGTASARVNCELCTNDRNGGLSGYLSGGVALPRASAPAPSFPGGSTTPMT